MLKRVPLVFVVLVALLPAVVSAQEANDGGRFDTLIRVNGPVHVPAGETSQGVIVISDDAVIEGAVDFLVVIDGDATISGTVEHQVFIVNGTVTIKDGARVGEEVLLYNANAVKDTGATVTGGVHKEWGGFTITRGLWFGFWVSMTIAVIAAGMIFAAFGGRQLQGAAAAVTGHTGQTLLTALVLWIGVPALAVILIATVIGIPLGLGILFFLLPALWFIGYLVAGAALGAALLRAGRSDQAERPYLPVLVGLVIFQIVALIPFIGGMVAFFAGLVGGGALLYRMWMAFRGTTAGQQTMPPTIPAAPTL